MYHISLGRLWVGLFPVNPISCGDLRLSRSLSRTRFGIPVCPSSTYDVLLDPGRISPACLCRWIDVAPTVLNIKASTLYQLSRLNNTPSVVAVYASCQHLYWLRKTRFRWLTTPCRIGLVTYRNISKCFFHSLMDIPTSRTFTAQQNSWPGHWLSSSYK